MFSRCRWLHSQVGVSIGNREYGGIDVTDSSNMIKPLSAESASIVANEFVIQRVLHGILNRSTHILRRGIEKAR